MKVLRRVLVTVLVVAVVLLVVDRVGVRVAEHLLAREVSSSLCPDGGAGQSGATVPASGAVQSEDEGGSADEGGADDASIHIDGFPVLTQAVRGRMDSVRVNIPTCDVDTPVGVLRISDASGTLHGIGITSPWNVQHLEAAGMVKAQDLASILASAGLPGTVTTGEDGISLGATFLGQQVAITISASVDNTGRVLVLTPAAASLGGVQVSLDRLVDLTGGIARVDVSLEELPEGLRVESIHTDRSGVRMSFVGTDVDLDQSQGQGQGQGQGAS